MARLSVIAVLSVVLLVSAACSSRSKEMKNAETYIQVNELGKAKELLDLEIQTNPKNAEAYVMLAKVFLLSGDPVDARAAFDKALLLDTGTKSEISKTYFEAAKGIAEKKGDLDVVAMYLQEAVTYNPSLKDKIVSWAVQREKTEASIERTTEPIQLLKAVSKVAPDSSEKISDALMSTANTYLDKQFLREAAAYAMEAGEQSPSKLNAASTVLRNACTLMATQDKVFARNCLSKAIQWHPAFADDDDVFWLTSVSLAANSDSGPANYLAKFPNGKHAADAKSILAERQQAAEQEARSRAELTYVDRDCDGTADNGVGAVYKDLSQQNINRFTVTLQPGCFSGYILLPQSWEYYRMEAAGPPENWWLAYKWYQSKNSGSGQNPPVQAAQLTTMRHGSHKIRVQGHGELVFYPIP